jgi:hypothetical protein
MSAIQGKLSSAIPTGDIAETIDLQPCMEPTVNFNTAVATDPFGLVKSLTEKWQMTGNKLEFNNKKKSVRKRK